MSLKDVRVRAPLWARKKDRHKRSFLVPQGPFHPPRYALPPRGRLGEDPQTPSHHRFPVAPAISRLSTVVPAFSRPWAPSRYPTPKSPPSGRGLWCPDGPFHHSRHRFPVAGMVCGQRVYNILTKNNLRNLNLQTPSFSGRSVV